MEETKMATEKTKAEETQQTDDNQNISGIKKLLMGIFSGDDTVKESNAESTKDEQEKKEPAKEETKGKTYTEADIQKLLEEKRQQWLNEAKEEERKKKLPLEEREKEEQAAKNAELEQLRAELNRKTLNDTARKALEKEGLPEGLADVLNYQDEATMTAHLEKVTGVFKKCLKEAVNYKLRGKTPAGLGGAAKAENALQDQIAQRIRGGK